MILHFWILDTTQFIQGIETILLPPELRVLSESRGPRSLDPEAWAELSWGLRLPTLIP